MTCPKSTIVNCYSRNESFRQTIAIATLEMLATLLQRYRATNAKSFNSSPLYILRVYNSATVFVFGDSGGGADPENRFRDKWWKLARNRFAAAGRCKYTPKQTSSPRGWGYARFSNQYSLSLRFFRMSMQESRLFFLILYRTEYDYGLTKIIISKSGTVLT